MDSEQNYFLRMIGCKKEESGGKLRKMWEGWVEYMGGSDGSEGGGSGGAYYYTLGTAPGTTNFTFSEGLFHVKKFGKIFLSLNICICICIPNFVFVFQYSILNGRLKNEICLTGLYQRFVFVYLCCICILIFVFVFQYLYERLTNEICLRGAL